MSVVLTIMGYGFREAVRRKVFAVVVLLTAAFLVLFWLATHYVFTRLSTIQPPADVHVDTRTFAGAFLLGLAMFATLFLGVVLAVFLTLGVVSGDAERGLLQPLVVRPVGRSTLLLSRFLGAAVVCIVYVLAVYGIALDDHRRDGQLDASGPARAGARARSRRRDRDRALDPRLRRPLLDGERDRCLHALRSRPHRRAARDDRARAELSHDRASLQDRGVGAAVRGALPGRAAPRSRATRAGSPASSSSSGRSAARTCTAGGSVSGPSATSVSRSR